MKHTIELCFILFYARLISSESIKFTNGKINVDEFLKSVMNSEKFNEIAEKIADKAVEKFSQLKNIGISPVSNVTLGEKYAYRVSEVDAKDNDSDSKHDDAETEIMTTQRDKNIIGKIDTEAFMKKEFEDSSNYLSLKYNQFTKGIYSKVPRELNKKQPTDGEEVAPSKEIIEDQSLEGENKQYDQRLAATKANHDESNVKKPILKTKVTTNRDTKHSKLKKKKHVKLTTPKKKDDSQSFEEKDSQHVKEDKSIPVSEQKVESTSQRLRASNVGESDQLHTDGSSESDSLHKDGKGINEENNDSEYKIRQPSYESLKEPESRKDTVSIKISKHNLKKNTSRLRKENFVIPRVSKKQEDTIESMRSPQPVREEGNKLYTFEKSPDYEDYHHDRIQNQRKNIH